MRLPTRLLRRKADSHKGDYGHVFIVAGSARFSGAAVLAATAALRSGAGLVTIGIPASLNTALIKIKPPEIMTLPLKETNDGSLNYTALKQITGFMSDADVTLIGPGLGNNPSTRRLIQALVARLTKPSVLDADGINALSGHGETLRAAGLRLDGRCVLTPHPGELSRLTGIPVAEIQRTRKEVAKRVSSEYNITVVLKGHRTVVAAPTGRIFINSTGNPGMSTAGSGDVLAGMIGAFLGQGLEAFDAAKYAAYLHGLAGDLAAKEKTQPGIIASDIIAMIPKAIKKEAANGAHKIKRRYS